MNPTASLSRRQLLQAGGIGALSLATPGMVAASVDPNRGRAASPAEVVHLHPAVRRAEPSRHLGPEARRPGRDSRPVQARSPRPCPACGSASCTRGWPTLTQHFSLIRSMTHVGNISNHFDAMHHCLSGQAGAPADSPYIGSILSQAAAQPERTSPTYVWLIKCVGDPVFCAPNIGTGGYLGAATARCSSARPTITRRCRPSARRTNCTPADARPHAGPPPTARRAQPDRAWPSRRPRHAGLARPARPGLRA